MQEPWGPRGADISDSMPLQKVEVRLLLLMCPGLRGWDLRFELRHAGFWGSHTRPVALSCIGG